MPIQEASQKRGQHTCKLLLDWQLHEYQWIAGSKIHYNAIFTLDFRSVKEDIGENAHVVGSLERIWSNSTFLTEEQLAALPMHRGKMWVFRRCLIGGVLLHWARVINESLQEMITVWNFNILTTCTIWFHTCLCQSWREVPESIT